MTFHKRAKCREINSFHYRRWTSLDGRFAVEESRWTGSRFKGKNKVPTLFRPMRLVDGDSRLIGSPAGHPTRAAAVRACEAAVRRG